METKSRYEVVADLEERKRDLIKERDSFDDELNNKEKEIKLLIRQKEDNIVIMDRKIDDAKESLEHFKSRIEDKKTTLNELIASIDKSLERFSNLGKKV